MYLQGVTKVCVGDAGNAGKLWLFSEVLSLPYNRSLVAVALAALAAAGGPVVAAAQRPRTIEAAQEGEPELLRIFCIGLGGAVPTFLAQAMPRCHVDVAELEPLVLQAAQEAMGFEQGPRLRVHVLDGAQMALREAQAAVARGSAGAYDAVLIDAYDSDGNVPEVMWRPDGGLAQALRQGLLRERGVVAVNFLRGTDLRPRLGAYREALAAWGAAPGLGFSVSAEEGNLMAVQTCGGPSSEISSEAWKERLTKAAREVQLATRSPFNMIELATNDLQMWDGL